MPIIARSADDILIDRMVATLQAFSAREAALDPAVCFRVHRDQLRPPALRELPLVNVWLESLAPSTDGAARTVGQEVATINLDCYARGLERMGTGADEAAAARLYYLKHQVKTALFNLISSDFGLPVGTIARRRWPRYAAMQPDLNDPEEQVVAGRWIVEVEYAWEPEDITGVTLDEIAVSQSSRATWSAVYSYTEEA